MCEDIQRCEVGGRAIYIWIITGDYFLCLSITCSVRELRAR